MGLLFALLATTVAADTKGNITVYEVRYAAARAMSDLVVKGFCLAVINNL